MKLTRKRLSLIIAFIVILAFSLVVFQVLNRNVLSNCQSGKEGDSPLLIFADEEMTCPVRSFNEPGVFHDFQLGWNNATFCIKNRGNQWVEIGMVVTMLPEGWVMIWDYDGSPIEPGSTVKAMVSVFCAYRLPVDSLMLGVNLKYRVVDGE